MYCPACGHQLMVKNAKTCDACGAETPMAHAAATDPSVALRAVVPVNISPFAIASFLGGLASLPIPLLGPIAVILGFIALHHVSRSEKMKGRGRAILGIIFGSIGTALLALILYVMFAP